MVNRRPKTPADKWRREYMGDFESEYQNGLERAKDKVLIKDMEAELFNERCKQTLKNKQQERASDTAYRQWLLIKEKHNGR